MVDELALTLGVDRHTVTARLDGLREGGCELETHPQLGVRLVATGVGVWRDYLEWLTALGDGPARVIEVYQSTGSTQDVVRRIVEAHGVGGDGCIAATQEQTAGRGRRGRVWYAPPGKAVTVSRGVVDRGVRERALSPERLSFASAVGVARAVERLLDWAGVRREVGIKWPNDVLVDGKKLAGVLVEGFGTHATPRRDAVQAAVIGVGLNVSVTPEDMPADDAALQRRVTSFAMLGTHVDRLRVLGVVVSELDWALACDDLELLMREWRQRCTLLSQAVRLQHDGRIIVGQVVDLDPHAGLVVRTTEGALVHLPSATTSVLE